MPAVLADHTRDPAQELWDEIVKTGSFVRDGERYPKPSPGFEFFANSVVVAVYHRPAVTKSGIILPDTLHGKKGDDRSQGKVGLVIHLGPLAYQNDVNRVFAPEEIVFVGDWVFFNPADGWMCHLPGQKAVDAVFLRVFTEDQIKGRAPHPDMLW